MKERKWEALLHMCSSADGRCDIWDHCRALLPLPERRLTPTAPHCHSCPVCASFSLLLSASPQVVPSGFLPLLCSPPEFLLCGYLFSSLPALPSVALSFAENLTTFNTLAVLHYFLSSFTLLPQHLLSLSSQKVGVVGSVAWAVGWQKAGNLGTAAGWKRHGKQCA